MFLKRSHVPEGDPGPLSVLCSKLRDVSKWVRKLRQENTYRCVYYFVQSCVSLVLSQEQFCLESCAKSVRVSGFHCHVPLKRWALETEWPCDWISGRGCAYATREPEGLVPRARQWNCGLPTVKRGCQRGDLHSGCSQKPEPGIVPGLCSDS